ncbi:MAG: hypothetical protein HDT38_00250 [Clostridiales bacterium]|nr:hypothetical protein [Clostridiales bacterium]
MKRLEQDYRDALDGLRFSKEAKERLMNGLMERAEQKPAKRRGVRPLRAGLIAAAVCVLLVGTAFAATTIYNLMLKTYDSWMYYDKELARFEIHGEADRYTLEDFSQELQDDYNTCVFDQHNNSGPKRSFDSWEDAKAYIGDDIPCTWRDTSGAAWEDEYYVQAVPDLSGETTNVQHVAFDSLFKLPGGQIVETVIYIYGEDYPYEELYGMPTPLGTDVRTLEDYPMANGCTARIIAQVSPPDPEGEWAPSYCIGFFTKDGILYEISLFGGNLGEIPMAEMESRLHQVLDTFY